MIKNKKELRQYLDYEKKMYIPTNIKNRIKCYIYKEPVYIIWKYIKNLRNMEFYYNNKKNIFCSIMYITSKKRKNRLQYKTGFDIPINCIEKGLKIYHFGNVVINENAHIGENCQIHGNVCIGNKGKENENRCPSIGDNADIGMNAIIIGDIRIGNNVKIGAGSIVTKSFTEDNIVLVGNPASKK